MNRWINQLKIDEAVQSPAQRHLRVTGLFRVVLHDLLLLLSNMNMDFLPEKSALNVSVLIKRLKSSSCSESTGDVDRWHLRPSQMREDRRRARRRGGVCSSSKSDTASSRLADNGCKWLFSPHLEHIKEKILSRLAAKQSSNYDNSAPGEPDCQIENEQQPQLQTHKWQSLILSACFRLIRDVHDSSLRQFRLF